MADQNTPTTGFCAIEYREKLEGIRLIAASVFPHLKKYELPTAEAFSKRGSEIGEIDRNDEDLAILAAVEDALICGGVNLTVHNDWGELAIGLARTAMDGFSRGVWFLADKYRLPQEGAYPDEDRGRNEKALRILNDPEHPAHDILTGFLNLAEKMTESHSLLRLVMEGFIASAKTEEEREARASQIKEMILASVRRREEREAEALEEATA